MDDDSRHRLVATYGVGDYHQVRWAVYWLNRRVSHLRLVSGV